MTEALEEGYASCTITEKSILTESSEATSQTDEKRRKKGPGCGNKVEAV